MLAAFQIFCNLLGIVAVPIHADSQGFQPQIQQECGVCCRIAAQIPHQLHSCLDNVGLVPEGFRVADAVIAFIRLYEIREFAVCPVKMSTVHNDAAHLERMTVHVLGGGVDHNVRTVFDGAAQVRRGEGVVHNQRQVIPVGKCGKTFNIQYGQSRIGQGLTEYQLGVGLDGSLQFLVRGFRTDENALDTQLLQGHSK